MLINVYQGRETPPEIANITIIIDVIRAFTVVHYAFLQGVKRVYLAKTLKQSFEIQKENPEYLLIGEEEGLPIKGFNLDNSPYNIAQETLAEKTLVQKTTNGVQATLNNLSSEQIYITGFTNAKTTANYIRKSLLANEVEVVNIIASHPSGDDDLACAEYIKSILKGAKPASVKKVIERITNSHVAGKFFDEENVSFNREDISYCIKELDTNFVMKVNKNNKIPVIERVNI